MTAGHDLPQQSAAPADDQLRHLLMAACRNAGLDSTNARLVRHFANAVYHLPSHNAVARLGYWPDAVQRATTSIQVTAWLIEQGFPATEPLAGPVQPVTVHEEAFTAAVSFWVYYPEPPEAGVPDASRLGRLVHDLHALPDPPIQLPPYRPLRSLRAAIDSTAGSSGLASGDRAWLTTRIHDLVHAYNQLNTALGTGLIHNDAHPENLLWHPASPTGVVLGDWDSVTVGPRELDLIAVDLEPRFGAPDHIRDQYAEAYGHDVRDLPAYATLRDLYSLRTLTALVRLAPDNPAAASELHHRITSLRTGNANPWKPW